MAERSEIRREAMARQGKVVKTGRRRFLIEGDHRSARFQMGEEGLVHYAVDQRTNVRWRLKCFWQPDDERFERSRYLVKQRLAGPRNGCCDVLGGAPVELMEDFGELSRFALVMKNVEGQSWKDLRQYAEQEASYPPRDWPSLTTRVLWAYALATAVEQMESRQFVHADLSDGNVVVSKDGDRAGDAALVDFDAYYNPSHPSNYRGTSGFVAPEIWDRGPVGPGSDRIAMSILIQDMLIVGDRSVGRVDAFSAVYSQEVLCAYEGKAHFLLWLKYRKLAELFEATLQTREPSKRPELALWRQALLELYEQSQWRRCTLEATDEHRPVRVSLNTVGRQDLSMTPFSIRGDVIRSADGSVRLTVHPGARLRFRSSGQTWLDLAGGTEMVLESDATIFDPGGFVPARFVIEDEGSAAPARIVPESFLPRPGSEQQSAFPDQVRHWIPTVKVTSALYFLLGFIFVVAAMLLTHSC